MSQPTDYNKTTNFSQYATSNPDAPYSAPLLEAELNAIETTLDETLTNLELIQRDDGLLKNGSVHQDSFSTAALALIGSTWTPRGLWVTARDYVVGDMVEEAGAGYVCAAEHTSGTFTADRLTGKWVFLNSTAVAGGYFDIATGTANAIVTDIVLPALSDGLLLRVRALLANTTTAVTLQTGADVLNIKRLGGRDLLVGDITGPGHVLDLVYQASNTTWELLNPGAVDKSTSAFALTLLDDTSGAAMLATIGAQPLDATLTALAALTIAAESLSIGTGADAFTQVTFAANTFPARASTGSLVAKTITDAALSVLDDTTVGAMLTTLGAQPLDATLTAFAALTIAAESLTIGTGADAFTQVTFAANKFPARASTGSLVAKDITDFALTLLDDTTAATARATLAIAGKCAIPVPATSMTPRSANGCAAIATSNGAANQPDIPYLAFDGAAKEYAGFFMRMPKSWNESTVTMAFDWRRASGTGAANVVWGMRAVAVSDADSGAATFGSDATVTDAASTTVANFNLSGETGACTIGGSPVEGDLVFFEVFRDGASGSDTLDAVDAWLTGITLFITLNETNDA